MDAANTKGSLLQFSPTTKMMFGNAKFRDGAKNFKQSKGAEKVFYKIDDIKNTDIENGGTDFGYKGEIDALSFEVAGFWNQ